MTVDNIALGCWCDGMIALPAAHLVHEEPGGEEESETEEADGQVGEQGGANGGLIAGHGAEVHVGSHDGGDNW